MPSSQLIRPVVAGLAALGLAAALAGCTATADETADARATTSVAPSTSSEPEPTPESSADGPSAEIEADCAVLETAIPAASASLQAGFLEYSNDPAAAVAAFREFTAQFAETRNSLHSPEVSAAAEEAGAAADDLVAALDAALADPANADRAALAEQASAFQAEFAGIGAACS